MAGAVSIPRDYLGQTLQEMAVKRGLLELNPDIHFDLGNQKNIWHPYMRDRQGVFYRGRFCGAMDRHTLPELPIWSLTKDLVEVPESDVKPDEMAIYNTFRVQLQCLKCKNVWEQDHRPIGAVVCPKLCGNIAQTPQNEQFVCNSIPTGTAWVWRQLRDRIMLVGWRHTFYQLLRSGVPGITKQRLELKFQIDLMPKVLDPIEVEEQHEAGFLDRWASCL